MNQDDRMTVGGVLLLVSVVALVVFIGLHLWWPITGLVGLWIGLFIGAWVERPGLGE